jgi:hypothetical protein
VPAYAHSTTAADAAARAAAKQLLQLPSLPIADDPVCVCPPGRDWDGLLGALSLNGSLDITNRAPVGRARVVGSTRDTSGAAGVGGADGAAQSDRSMMPPPPPQQQAQQQQQQLHTSAGPSALRQGPDGVTGPQGQVSTGPQGQDCTGPQGQIITGPQGQVCCCGLPPAPLQLQYYASELALLQGFCAVVQGLDPDVIVGWDIQQGSLGYLADRGLQLGFNVLRSASKTPEVSLP